VFGILLPVRVDPDHSVTCGDIDLLVRVDVRQFRPHHEGVAVVKLLDPEPLLIVVKIARTPPRQRRPADDMSVAMNKERLSSIPLAHARAIGTMIYRSTTLR
jgi:hypothetical protein